MRFGFLLKIVMMVFALVGVLYFMRLLKSPAVHKAGEDPNSIVGLLVGSDLRMLNWCPSDVEKVELFQEDNASSSRFLTTPQDLSAVCEILVGGYAEGAEPPRFALKMKAYSKGAGNPVSLEKAIGAGIYRYKGMPFASPGLDKVLKRLETP